MLLLVLGIALIVAAAYDAVITTLALKDAGPISGRIAGRLWLAMRRIHSWRPSHRLLSYAGTVIILVVLWTWLALMWIGWSLVFSASPDALQHLQTGEQATFVQRLYFVGFTITTLGIGDIVPTEGWRIATILCASTGLVFITLAITYFAPVLEAVMASRRMATFVAAMGRSPQELILTAWHEGDLRGLDSYLANLADMLNSHTHRHHGYPVVHYFHSPSPEAAVPLRLAVLDEALSIMSHAIAPDVRPHPSSLHVLTCSTSSYLHVLRAVYIDAAADPPPPPDLEPLRAAGIPLLPKDEIDDAFARLAKRRCLLRGLVEHDGWNWADVPLDREGVTWPGDLH